jgi:hypothetical protein
MRAAAFVIHPNNVSPLSIYAFDGSKPQKEPPRRETKKPILL